MAKEKANQRPQVGESRAKRPERIPVSGNRDILAVQNQDPAYIYRWVNDVDDRLYRFEQGGWEKLYGDIKVGQVSADSSKGASSIITKNVGAGRTAYLMRIRREWYEEDQSTKSKQIAEMEKAMLAKERNSEGRYGSVSVK